MVKQCSCCGLFLDIHNFTVDKSKRTGLRPRCKLCVSTGRLFKRLEFGKTIANNQRFSVLPGFSSCSACKRILLVSDFYPSKYNKTKLTLKCKNCISLSIRLKARDQGRKRLSFSVLPGYKYCASCDNIKLTSDFSHFKYANDNFNYRCKICTNSDPVTKLYRQAKRKQLRKIPEHNIRLRITNDIHRKFNLDNKFASISKYLPYTFGELKNFLERKFTKGMTWDAFLDGDIEIDHIIPYSAFCIKSLTDETLRICWSLCNLSPRWKGDNKKKSDKLPNGLRARDMENKIRDVEGYNKLLDCVDYSHVYEIYDDF